VKNSEKIQLYVTTAGNEGNGKTALVKELLNLVPSSSKTDATHIPLDQQESSSFSFHTCETRKRKFVIADPPGNIQQTPDMLTGSVSADLAIVVVDAEKGFSSQGKRHSFLISLIRIPHIIVAINKMDLVEYSEEVFLRIISEYRQFSEKLDTNEITFIPVSARQGDNLAVKSSLTPWYEGSTLLHCMDNVHAMAGKNLIDFRYPVYKVTRQDNLLGSIEGTVVSGALRLNEEVVVLPAGSSSTVISIIHNHDQVKEASASQKVTLALQDDLDIHKGDMLVRRKNLPQVGKEFDAILYWTQEKPMKIGTAYALMHTTNQVKAYISETLYKINIDDLHRIEPVSLGFNEFAKVKIKTDSQIFFDSYKENRHTGIFTLLDLKTAAPVATGLIRGLAKDLDAILEQQKVSVSKSTNVFWQDIKISRLHRESYNKHKAAVFWLTGLSSAGKSTIAKALEAILFEEGFQTVILDGDNVRHGLCGDLGFSDEDRTENIRRVGEVAKLFFETGIIAICTFISPFKKDREFVRQLIPPDRFFEVHVKCGLDVCVQRDTKGLYKKALAGKIPDFTGISSHYEEPEKPEITVQTDKESLDDIIDRLAQIVKKELGK
jgi:bifunctional enzyme CysN/CysC